MVSGKCGSVVGKKADRRMAESCECGKMVRLCLNGPEARGGVKNWREGT